MNCFFKSIKRPLKNGRSKTLPDWLCKILAEHVTQSANSNDFLE
ncbi:Uncharacterised protein [Candidatus Tiddalikarchaeum anstoanum]|nr:Uncharacterised protein [Candidatus Tiddalikarchaeum anstoanum]